MNKPRIVIVEDDEITSLNLNMSLQKQGYSVVGVCDNAQEAKYKISASNPDLVIVDISLDKSNDGIELAKTIKEKYNLPFISALTANVLKGAKERGLLSGFDEFLVKPLVLKELERVFSSYLKADAHEYSLKRQDKKPQKELIIGLDSVALMETLMLNEEEVLTLLKLYLKKMKKVMPELLELIEKKDYENIAHLAHSIKGSSANFRIEVLQEGANKIELMAKDKNETYDYETCFANMSSFLAEIKVV